MTFRTRSRRLSNPPSGLSPETVDYIFNRLASKQKSVLRRSRWQTQSWMLIACTSALAALNRHALPVAISGGTLVAAHADRAIQQMLKRNLEHWTEAPQERLSLAVRVKGALDSFLLVMNSRAVIAESFRRHGGVQQRRLFRQFAVNISLVAILREIDRRRPDYWHQTILDGDVSVTRALIYEASRSLSKPTHFFRQNPSPLFSLPLDCDVLFTNDPACSGYFRRPPKLIVHEELPRRRRRVMNESQLHIGVVTDNFIDEAFWMHLIQELAAHSVVARVQVRVHPRSTLRLQRPTVASRVLMSSPSVPLSDFAEQIDFALVSKTTAALTLRQIGVPCFRIPALNPQSDASSDPTCLTEPLATFLNNVCAEDLQRGLLQASVETHVGTPIRTDVARAMLEILTSRA